MTYADIPGVSPWQTYPKVRVFCTEDRRGKCNPDTQACYICLKGIKDLQRIENWFQYLKLHLLEIRQQSDTIGLFPTQSFAQALGERQSIETQVNCVCMVFVYCWLTFLNKVRFLNFWHFFCSEFDINFTGIFFHDSNHFLSILKKNFIRNISKSKNVNFRN